MGHLLTRDQALAAFERFRAVPGAPFEESHFLDYLVANSARRGSTSNGEGRRRLIDFIEAIQLEYGICFSLADLDRSFSLDAFVERANVLQASRRGSLASLKTQERADPGWTAVVLLDLILVGISVHFRSTPVVPVILLFLAVLLSAAFAVFANRNRRYLVDLRNRIESNTSETPPNTSLERTRER
jgi:hypothetical protein